MKRQFRAGEFITTTAAEAALDDTDLSAGHFLARYLTLDFGYINEEQRELNERAIKDRQGEIRGIYKTVLGVELWLVTDKAWSKTYLMLPDEFDEIMG